jgi:hypothetical protein
MVMQQGMGAAGRKGAVLRLPPNLLLAAQSRRTLIVTSEMPFDNVPAWANGADEDTGQKAKSPDDPTEAIAPTRNPQST